MDFLLGCLGAAEAEIVHDRTGEQEIFLRDDAELAMERLDGGLGDVVAVDENAAALRLVEAGEQADDAGLAGAGVADERDGLAGLGEEVDVVEHPAILGGGLVAEADVFKMDLAGDERERRGSRAGR